jgi:lipopolysaccharide biosynthesis glycosyltransferase
MKTFLYTVSDFKNGALECIDLLIDNLKDRDFDFAIISNKNTDCKYDVIIDSKDYQYIGFLKYSEKIPEGYDQYIYLDSDILYFGEIKDLFNESKEFSIVKEKLLMSNEWFKYPYNNSFDYINEANSNLGLNAGTFCYKNISFLNSVRELYTPFISQDIHLDARLEQSSYNLALSKSVDFDFSKCHDLTDKTVLFADQYPFSKEKTIYHFCGFSNEMNSKFFKMKNFYDNIKI